MTVISSSSVTPACSTAFFISFHVIVFPLSIEQIETMRAENEQRNHQEKQHRGGTLQQRPMPSSARQPTNDGQGAGGDCHDDAAAQSHRSPASLHGPTM